MQASSRRTNVTSEYMHYMRYIYQEKTPIQNNVVGKSFHPAVVFSISFSTHVTYVLSGIRKTTLLTSEIKEYA